MKLFIKNMVCSRCKTAVHEKLIKAGLTPVEVTLGEVEIKETTDKKTLHRLATELQEIGFEIVDNHRKRLIEKIKTIVIDFIHHTDDHPATRLSDIITGQLHYDYTYLSNLFSEVEGRTIEKYVLIQKAEKIKELLMYDELTVSQIADQLGYSSVSHLSSQFKKQTGLTPSFYKRMKRNTRRDLNDL